MKNVVYSIKCEVDNKRYIGQSKDFEKRKVDHLFRLRNNSHYNNYLQRAFNKYGEESFVFEVLESNCIDLNFAEKFWIVQFNTIDNKCGYNMNYGGCDSSSKEYYRKISLYDKQTGKKVTTFETIADCANHFGTKLTPIHFALCNPTRTYKKHYIRDYDETILQIDVERLKYESYVLRSKAGKRCQQSKSLTPDKLLSTEDLLPMITGPIYDESIQTHSIDLNVIKIDKLKGGGFIPKEGKTILPVSEEINPEENIWNLQPGTYNIVFEQGCNIPSYAMLLIRQRSSLARNGGFIHSSIFDAGFKTNNIGTIMVLTNPLKIEVGARIGTIYGHACEKSSKLYSGQWQNDSQRTDGRQKQN